MRVAKLIASVFVLLSACDGDDPTADEAVGPGAPGKADDPAASDSDAREAGSAGCGSDAVVPGKHMRVELSHDGLERTFDLLVPASYDPDTPTPLVVNFHGFTSNAQEQSTLSQMDRAAEEAGVIVAYPQGTDDSWNAGACCGNAKRRDVDDVGFVRELVSQISEALCVAPDRVYATGMSNGGFMTHRLACEADDVFAAIATVAGTMASSTSACDGRPVPVMHFHGTSDFIVPYSGGILSSSVDDTIDFWATHNGCADESEVTFAHGNVTCETWSDCTDDADVTRCRIRRGGHCWPGNDFCPLGRSTMDIDATTAALDFFAEHPMP